MNTKRIWIFAAALALAASGAQGGDALLVVEESTTTTTTTAPQVLTDAFVATAKVVSSSPIVETVLEPVEECKHELRRVGQRAGSQDKSNRLVGGVLGAAAGSALGSGRGKDAAAAAGAVLGSEVGAQDGGLSGGELVGGVAGGIIGNQIGSGSGRTAATAAGALLGSLLSDELENGPSRRTAGGEYRKVRVCSYSERAKKIITGYKVVYEYNGHMFTGALSHQPGAFVKIAVSAELLENRTSRVETECGSAAFPCERVGRRVEYIERDNVYIPLEGEVEIYGRPHFVPFEEEVEIYGGPHFVPYPYPVPSPQAPHAPPWVDDHGATLDSESVISGQNGETLESDPQADR